MSRVRKKRKKDYQSKNLQNPFFQKKKQGKGGKKKLSWKSCLIILILIVIIGGSFWFFYLSPTFTIKNIEINGLSRNSPDTIREVVRQEGQDDKKFYTSRNNLFVFNDDKLIETLQKHYNFAKIEVKKVIPDTIQIKVTERSFEAIWLEAGSYYFIDHEGFVVEKINTLESVNPTKYPIIDNESAEYINQQKVGINDNYLEFIINSWQELQQRDSQDIIIEKFIIKNELGSLDAQVLNGPILYLNTKNDYNQQILNLIVLKNEELHDDFYKKTYIDLRYQEKVYYY